jgi:eukaryotic-like serine/threonine-protein kinase
MVCSKCHRRYEDDHLFCPHDGERLVATVDIKRIRSKPTEHAGEIIGDRYQVRGLLGRGATAQVFVAQDRTTGAPVAVKVLEAKHLKEPRARARFILEAKAVAKVSHPSVIQVLDIGLRADGAPYMVVEFLFGESLGEWLRRERVMSIEAGLPFALQIASGLAAAHREGVVHRDIKPDNVFLLGEKGAPYAIKIVDFGFAKLAEHHGVTQAGVAVGTVDYMAPEQAVSDGSDARTDVYGLGMLMYRMFAGRLPFKRRSEPEMLAHQLLTPAPPLGLGPIHPAPWLEEVILKAIRKRPENRYPSMDALMEDLKRLKAPPRSGIALTATQPIELPDAYAPKTPFGAAASRFLETKIVKSSPAE